jgi:hypothetical protein
MDRHNINSIVVKIGFISIFASLLLPLIWTYSYLPFNVYQGNTRLWFGVFFVAITMVATTLPNEVLSRQKSQNWYEPFSSVISIVFGIFFIMSWIQFETIKDNDISVGRIISFSAVIDFSPFIAFLLFSFGMHFLSTQLADWIRYMWSIYEETEAKSLTNALNWDINNETYLKIGAIVTKENEQPKKQMIAEIKKKLEGKIDDKFDKKFDGNINLSNEFEKVVWDFDTIFNEGIEKVSVELENNHEWPQSAREGLKLFAETEFKASIVSKILRLLLDDIFVNRPNKECGGKEIIFILRLLDNSPTDEEYDADKGEKYLLSKFYRNNQLGISDKRGFNRKLQAFLLLVYSQYKSSNLIADSMNINIDPMRADLIDEIFIEVCDRLPWGKSMASEQEIFYNGIESIMPVRIDSIATPANIKVIQQFIGRLDSRLFMAMQEEEAQLNSTFEIIRDKIIEVFQKVDRGAA